MPSFDVVSEVDMQEVNNALDQAKREIANRFDFKGTNARFELSESVITLHAQVDFQLKQMLDILNLKLAKRGVDVACLKIEEPEITSSSARQDAVLRQGLDAELAKKMVKMIKSSKMKVQSAIQGQKIRVTGKKRDDLQAAIALLKEADIDLPLQFENFRD